MRAIAKIVIYDSDGNVLKLVRSGTHPKYPHEIDMPGGIVEKDETPERAAVRETIEETGLIIIEDDLQLVKKQLAYWGAIEYLYTIRLDSSGPEVTVSWEHESWEWASRELVMQQCAHAKDSYMNLTAEYLAEGTIFDIGDQQYASISE